MKYIDADRMIAEIERRIKEHDAIIDSQQGSERAERHAWEWAEDKRILEILDTFEAEQPSLPEGVDEAADDYICDIRTAYCELEDGKKLFTEDEAAATFKAGAEWRDTQIKKLLEILLDNLEEAAEFFEKYFPKKRQEVK